MFATHALYWETIFGLYLSALTPLVTEEIVSSGSWWHDPKRVFPLVYNISLWFNFPVVDLTIAWKLFIKLYNIYLQAIFRLFFKLFFKLPKKGSGKRSGGFVFNKTPHGLILWAVHFWKLLHTRVSNTIQDTHCLQRCCHFPNGPDGCKLKIASIKSPETLSLFHNTHFIRTFSWNNRETMLSG